MLWIFFQIEFRYLTGGKALRSLGVTRQVVTGRELLVELREPPTSYRHRSCVL